MRHRAFFGLALFLVVVIVVGGCGRGGFSERKGADVSGELRVALDVNPTTLDPGIVQDIATTDLLSSSFEGLVGYDDDNRLVGVLAQGWKVEDKGRTLVFTLRTAKFHDGRPVTAKDVKATFERNLSPGFKSPTARLYLGDIVGATEFAAGKAPSVKGLVVRDEETLVVTLDQPRAYFLGKLAAPPAWVLPADTGTKEIADPKLAIGTGPFRIESVKPEQEVVQVPFAEYHGAVPKVARLVRPVAKDPVTRLNMMKSGELSYLGLVRADLKEALPDPKLREMLQWQPRPAVWYIAINQKTVKPFRDIRVRRAFAMALNRTALCRDILGDAPEAAGLIPPGIMGHRADYKGLPLNPKEARLLLKEAGFPAGKGLPPLKITIRDQSPDARLIAEAFASDVKKVLGVEVQIRTMEWRSFLEARNRGELGLYVLSWYADYLDPENFLSLLLRSDSPQNRDGYKSEEFDRLTRLADVETDTSRRKTLYQQAEDVAVEEAARIPITFVRDAVLVSPEVQGLKANLLGTMPPNTVEVR